MHNTSLRALMIASIAGSVLAVTASGAVAGNSDTATATVEIVAPIEVAATQNMNLGVFAAANNGSSNDISVQCDGTTVGPVGGGNGSWIQNAGVSEAVFSIAGAQNAGYSYQTTSTMGGTGLSLAVTSTGTGSAPSCSGLAGASGTLDPVGSDEVHVGATLTIDSGTLPGTYTGTISLTANYQ